MHPIGTTQSAHEALRNAGELVGAPITSGGPSLLAARSEPTDGVDGKEIFTTTIDVIFT